MNLTLVLAVIIFLAGVGSATWLVGHHQTGFAIAVLVLAWLTALIMITSEIKS